jgi:hypothetical protein
MKRILLALTAVGACVALAGCTGETPAAPASSTTTVTTIPTLPSADPQLVTWLDGFCGAVHGYRLRSNAYLEAMPANQTLSVAEAHRATSKDMGQFADNAGQTVDELKALPTVSDPQTETAKKSFLDKFTEARDRVVTAKAKLDATRPGNDAAESAATDALTAAQKDISGFSDPLKPFGEAQTYVLAAIKAPKCKPAS